MASNHLARVDTLELKDQICRKIGQERSRHYFDHLKRFLSLQLSKSEFDKSCVQILGKENISLHNQLIRAIVQNANNAKTPPPQKPNKVDGPGKSAKKPSDTFLHLRKCKLPANRKFKADRPSPLGPLGKSTSITYEETVMRVNESPTELRSLSSKPPFVEDGEEVEQLSEGSCDPRWSHVVAPLAAPMYLGGESSASGSGDGVADRFCHTNGELPDTTSLRSSLANRLAPEGLGISMDCCNLLNRGLDAFLRKQIAPCIEARRGFGYGNNQVMWGNGIRPLPQTYISMLDYQVAMQSNPHLLGQIWPAQFEKMFHHSHRS